MCLAHSFAQLGACFLPLAAQAEWIAVLRQVKAQCEDPANRFGFPNPDRPVKHNIGLVHC